MFSQALFSLFSDIRSAVEGDNIKVPGTEEHVTWTRRVTRPELSRARRQFLVYLKMRGEITFPYNTNSSSVMSLATEGSNGRILAKIGCVAQKCPLFPPLFCPKYTVQLFFSAFLSHAAV